MQNRFSCNYARAAVAGPSAWQWIKKYWKLNGRDTAVIVNTDSMSVQSKGHFSHSYKRSQAARGTSVKVKRTTWAHVVERDHPTQNRTPLSVLAASVHFPRGSEFRSERANRRLKKRFSVRTAKFLEARRSDGSRRDEVIHVIGGDFNMHRHKGSKNRPMPHYRTLRRRFGYVDGPIAHTTGSPNPIDFLFATGKPLRAGMDRHNPHKPGADGFYSNHDLRWSLLAPYQR